MRTIFALFESLDEARAVVAELIDRRFGGGEMNVIVRVSAARAAPGGRVRAVGRTRPAEKERLQAIDRLLSEGRRVDMADVGVVRLAGRIGGATTAGAATPEERHRVLRMSSSASACRRSWQNSIATGSWRAASFSGCELRKAGQQRRGTSSAALGSKSSPTTRDLRTSGHY